MSPACDSLDEYLDGRLMPASVEQFEAHVRGCASCQRAVSNWEASRGKLNAWAKTFDRAPTSREVQALLEKAEAPKASWLPRSAGLAFVAAAALLAFFVLRPTAAKSVDLSDAMAMVELDGDRVAVAPGSRATVRELALGQTRVRLESGSVVSKVKKRLPGGYFIVESGDVEVRVVGTLFQVERKGAGPISVRVREGRVEVWRASTRLQTLSAGDAWNEGEPVHPLAQDELRSMLEPLGEPMPKVETVLVAPPAPIEVAPAPVPAPVKEEPSDGGERLAKKTEQWVRACGTHGALAATAQQEMEAHLRAAPRDSETWQLLGLCRKSNGDAKGAVDAYKKAIRHGNAVEANAARLGLAEVEEKLRDYKAVKELIHSYLKQPPATHVGEAEASAMIKLAHAQMALGENDEAKATFQLLIKKHPRSPLAAEAQSQLQSL